MFIVSAAPVARYNDIRFQVCAWSGSVYRSASRPVATASETSW
ncbi:hypothetical protein AB0N50_36225 [Streptomyces pharetrae]|jgi:hypothetical protein